jgi:hypothetical protein
MSLINIFDYAFNIYNVSREVFLVLASKTEGIWQGYRGVSEIDKNVILF